MPTRDQICSQYRCMSCPLSISVTGKDCRSMNENDIESIMHFVRILEADHGDHNLIELFSHIREENTQLNGEHPI